MRTENNAQVMEHPQPNPKFSLRTFWAEILALGLLVLPVCALIFPRLGIMIYPLDKIYTGLSIFVFKCALPCGILFLFGIATFVFQEKIAATLILMLSGFIFFGCGVLGVFSPYEAIPSVMAEGHVYRLFHPMTDDVDIYILYACDQSGIVCRQIFESDYLQLDDHPTLYVDASTQTISLVADDEILYTRNIGQP